jgi:hypothetical protein
LKLPGSFRGQGAVFAEFSLPLISPPVELASDIQNIVPLSDHPVPQLLDVAYQGAILLAGEIEVLVSAQQVPEAFGGEMSGRLNSANTAPWPRNEPGSFKPCSDPPDAPSDDSPSSRRTRLG